MVDNGYIFNYGIPLEQNVLESVSYNLLGLVPTFILSRIQYSYVYVRVSRSKLWKLWPYGYFEYLLYFLKM